MAKMLADGHDLLLWIPEGGIEDLAAPTVAELTAASVINLSCLVAKEGFNFGASGESEITDPPLCAVGQFTSPGNITYNDDMNFYRYTTTVEDIPWETFTGQGIPGILAHRDSLLSDAPIAAAQEFEIHEVLTGVQRKLPADGNGGFRKFGQKFHPQSAVPRALVAA